MSGFSEDEDDPAVYESSGDEWDESVELEKKRNTRRTSQRLSKKPRITHVETSDSDSDEDEDEDEYNSYNGAHKKTKKTPTKTSPANKTPVVIPISKAPKSPPRTSPKSHSSFTTGTFVISKKDAQEGTPENPPCIWKIDGKALLQKYEPFEEDGKVRHRNTSIYTGWSSLDKDEYASVQVQVYVQSGQKMVVEMNWEQLKTIEIEDSD